MPGPTATAALASALRPVGAEHRVWRLVSSLLTGDDPPLVAAFVGPSGVGKSTLVNRLAGESVATAGALRPTTVAPVEWVAPDGRLRLIDTPPADVLPDPGCRLIEGADMVVVVTSQLRYADAATWEWLARVRESGIPAVIAVNRVEPVVADLVADEVADRAGDLPVVAIDEGFTGNGIPALRDLLDAAATDVAAIRGARRHGLAGEAAVEVRRLSEELAAAEEERVALAEAVAEAAASRSIPVADVTSAARGTPEDFDAMTGALIEAESRLLIDALADVWSSRGLLPPDVSASLRAGDAAALERWRRETADRFVAEIAPGWLRRPLGRRVGADSWRVAIGRPPRGLVRLALGKRAGALAAERAEALSAVLVDRLGARVEPFAAAVPEPSPIDPRRLESLAGRLEAEHPAVPSRRGAEV